AVGSHGVGRAYGHMIEDAKTHCPRALGVMARGPDGAKCRPAFTLHDEVGGEHQRTGSMLGRVDGVGTERGVRIDVIESRVRTRGFDRRDVARTVDAGELLARS